MSRRRPRLRPRSPLGWSCTTGHLLPSPRWSRRLLPRRRRRTPAGRGRPGAVRPGRHPRRLLRRPRAGCSARNSSRSSGHARPTPLRPRLRRSEVGEPLAPRPAPVGAAGTATTTGGVGASASDSNLEVLASGDGANQDCSAAFRASGAHVAVPLTSSGAEDLHLHIGHPGGDGEGVCAWRGVGLRYRRRTCRSGPRHADNECRHQGEDSAKGGSTGWCCHRRGRNRTLTCQPAPLRDVHPVMRYAGATTVMRSRH